MLRPLARPNTNAWNVLVPLVTTVVGLTGSSAAYGEEARDRVHLVIQASVGCDPALFSDALERRVIALDPAWRELRLEARVARKGAQLEGRVWATSELGSGTARTVVGATCEETLRSVALLAAIALDAASRERTEAARAAPAAPEPSPPQTATPKMPSVTAIPPPLLAPRKVDGIAGPPADVEKARSRWRPLAGAGVEISSLGVFATPFAGIERSDRAWPLAFKLGAVLGAGDVDPNIPAMHTHSRWRAARIEGCPWQLAFASSVHARPCLALDVGAVRTELVSPPGGSPTPTTNSPWIAPRLDLRLGWDAFSWLRLEADGALAAGFSKPEWEFQHGFITSPQWPIVAFGAGAALALP